VQDEQPEPGEIAHRNGQSTGPIAGPKGLERVGIFKAERVAEALPEDLIGVGLEHLVHQGVVIQGQGIVVVRVGLASGAPPPGLQPLPHLVPAALTAVTSVLKLPAPEATATISPRLPPGSNCTICVQHMRALQHPIQFATRLTGWSTPFRKAKR
jgi:hypothetical protein